MDEPTPERGSMKFTFGGLELDIDGKIVRLFDSGGGESLSTREVIVLSLLMEMNGAEVPPARMEAAFRKGYVGSNLHQDLSNTVASIRRKLTRIRGHRVEPAKIRNAGYRLRINPSIRNSKEDAG